MLIYRKTFDNMRISRIKIKNVARRDYRVLIKVGIVVAKTS